MKTSELPLDYLRNDQKMAAMQLAEHLGRGELVLVIGAGASLGMGLPSWHELVRRLLRGRGQDDVADSIADDTPAEELRRHSNSIEPEFDDNRDAMSSYLEEVKHGLYGDNCDESHFREAIVSRPLFTALGALLMGSRRGSVREVITYNFDDSLEWYLQVHGFTSQVMVDPLDLRRDVDVTVWHPHGLIPTNRRLTESDFLILSERSFERRIGRSDAPWIGFFRTILLNRVALFVGFSGNDPVFKVMARQAHDKLKRTRPVGYWMRGPKDYVGTSPNGAEELAARQKEADDQVFDYGFIPMRFDSYEEWPQFFLQLCEMAAERANI
jgi:hypothetical protein